MTEEKKPRKSRTAVEVPTAPRRMDCRGHNQLHMCFNCKDSECKDKGYFKMHRCKNFFWWVVSLGILMVTMVGAIAAYLIIRIADENWTDWKLPMYLIIGFMAVALAVLTFVAVIDYRHRTGDAIYE